MKKTLVAIAALAAFGAQAQSSVQIDGLMDAGYQSLNLKGTKVNGIQGNGSGTSQINFRGTSDLGGGLKADFRVETDWSVVSNKANQGTASSTSGDATKLALDKQVNATAGTFGNGELRVGLDQAGIGRIDFGAINFNTLDTLGTGQPYGTAIGGGYGSVSRVDAAGTAVRDENQVRLSSATFSGFKAVLNKSAKQTKANNGASASTSTGLTAQQTAFSTTLGAYDKLGSTEVGVNYANGPLAASYSTLKQDSVSVGTGTTATTVNTLGANYTMGAIKGMFLNQTVKTTTGTVATDTSYNAYSVVYTMGNTELMASTGKLKQDVGTYAGKESKLTSFGANYNLSKTTSLYLRSESIKDDAAVIAAAATTDVSGNTKRTRTAIGLKTNF
ncbi:porin [Limnohabitans sp. MORI2]|uniref:porin n=1 Tax=Limnohabitans sp. MORI2 TaxID=1751150 RepID=UPI00237745FA|nr:porin [Limnohabitans sp. MORI2]BDU57370.1 porin [Limnohabitans sp. MORI2]